MTVIPPLDDSDSPALEAGQTVGELLLDLADRVKRLSPDRRDPERYHLEKSDVVHEMRLLARRIDAVGCRTP